MRHDEIKCGRNVKAAAVWKGLSQGPENVCFQRQHSQQAKKWIQRLELPTKEEEKLSDLVNVVLKQEKKPHLSLVSHRI